MGRLLLRDSVTNSYGGEKEKEGANMLLLLLSVYYLTNRTNAAATLVFNSSFCRHIKTNDFTLMLNDKSYMVRLSLLHQHKTVFARLRARSECSAGLCAIPRN
jgi:hypothetical protein